MVDSERNKQLALELVKLALGGNGTVHGVLQLNKGSCVAVFSQDYKGKKYGVIRQLLYGDEDTGPTFTKKGLNAPLTDWLRVRDALRDAKSLDLASSSFLEIIKLPQQGSNNATQVYSHIYREEPRIVIGKIFNYKEYSGKGVGASFSATELDIAIEILDQLVEELGNKETTLNKPPVEKPSMNVNDSKNDVDYKKIYGELF